MKMGYGVTEAEVEDYYVADIPTAYPVYELNFEEHLIPVLEGVHAVPNLLTLGRHGLFLNNSMDDNVLLGMKIGDHIGGGGFNSRGWLSEMLAFMNLRFDGQMSGRSAARRQMVGEQRAAPVAPAATGAPRSAAGSARR